MCYNSYNENRVRRIYWINNLWPRQESNLDLELRKLLYYPLYYEACRYIIFPSV